MILLLGLSMLLSGTITFILYKVLQLYYAGVQAGDPLAKFRHLINDFGDLNFFLIMFYSSCNFVFLFPYETLCRLF